MVGREPPGHGGREDTLYMHPGVWWVYTPLYMHPPNHPGYTNLPHPAILRCTGILQRGGVQALTRAVA